MSDKEEEAEHKTPSTETLDIKEIYVDIGGEG